MIAELWAFLSTPQHQQTLAWLGGGLVVVIGGLWSAFTYAGSRRTAAPSDEPMSSRHGALRPEDDRRSSGPYLLAIIATVGLVAIAALLVGGNRQHVDNGIINPGEIKDSHIEIGR